LLKFKNPAAPAVKRKAEEDWERMAVKRTQFSSASICGRQTASIVKHVAGVEDYQVPQATYRAAVERWPGGVITLRQGARVIDDSRRTRLASWADKGRQGGR